MPLVDSQIDFCFYCLPYPIIVLSLEDLLGTWSYGCAVVTHDSPAALGSWKLARRCAELCCYSDQAVIPKLAEVALLLTRKELRGAEEVGFGWQLPMTRFLLAAGVHLGGRVWKVRKNPNGKLGAENRAGARRRAGGAVIGLSLPWLIARPQLALLSYSAIALLYLLSYVEPRDAVLQLSSFELHSTSSW